MIIRAVVALACGLLAHTYAVAGEKMRWYASHGSASEQEVSQDLGDRSTLITRSGGWKCSIGSPSTYNARQSLCEMEKSRFEFTVECDSGRPRDHTQVRFRDSQGKLTGYVEVGWEMAK